MLHSIALDFYYGNKATYITFNRICNAIYNHFKGPEYKRSVLMLVCFNNVQNTYITIIYTMRCYRSILIILLQYNVNIYIRLT